MPIRIEYAIMGTFIIGTAIAVIIADKDGELLLAKAIAEADKNKNGRIDPDEASEFLLQFDKDGDRHLSKDELAEVNRAFDSTPFLGHGKPLIVSERNVYLARVKMLEEQERARAKNYSEQRNK